ncbi:rho GTPase-activating protein 25 [Callorhinchus milii]|uniref:rho GTPase-activating protein 25 n=1 Tax=Callorhinchus milii TaxID=7868 RepID=UPI001C3F62BD|nr:rho GTPase-activating protein 25 [Callorhinchus milii]
MSLKLPRTVRDFNLKTDSGRIGRSKSVMPGESNSASNRPPSPNMLDRPVKSGWLKKQRSIVKNWSPRWFVLRGCYLLYHKEEDDGKIQGSIVLQDCKVNELPSNPEDPGRFMFEIVPGATGDRERTGGVQDSCTLMANSQSEMEDWVKALRRAMGSLSSGAVFGQRLAHTVSYEQKFGQHLVPIVVEQCADFIREHGLNEEGIFRLPGQDNLVKQLRDTFDSGERPSFNQDTDVHTVASLFKLYVRELPEPVVPWAQYEDFLACSQIMNGDEDGGQQELVKQLTLLPQVNYNLLCYICRFLYEVQLHSNINKMSVDNLATVIGVNLLKPKIEDPVAIMRGTPQIQKLMTVLISDHKTFFPKHKDKTPSPTHQASDGKKGPVQRSSVGWDAAEMSMGGTSEMHVSRQIGISTVNITEASQQESSWIESPRKRTQTLPAGKCTLSSVKEMNGVKTGGDLSNWGALAGDGAGRAELGESQKQKNQRFSVYESVPTQGPTSNSADVAGEVYTAPKPARNPLPKTQSFSAQGQDQPEDRETPEGAEVDLEGMGLEEMQRELLVLRQEMNNQKKTIEGLEKENYEVWARVVRMSGELEEEKKKYAGLEIKLRNRVRAQEDAERRNQVLEEEIKDFCKIPSDTES